MDWDEYFRQQATTYRQLAMARRIYFGVAGIAFRLLAGSANHPIYDYRVHLHEANLSLAEAAFCGPFYWTLKTVRK